MWCPFFVVGPFFFHCRHAHYTAFIPIIHESSPTHNRRLIKFSFSAPKKDPQFIFKWPNRLMPVLFFCIFLSSFIFSSVIIIIIIVISLIRCVVTTHILRFFFVYVFYFCWFFFCSFLQTRTYLKIWNGSVMAKHHQQQQWRSKIKMVRTSVVVE